MDSCLDAIHEKVKKGIIASALSVHKVNVGIDSRLKANKEDYFFIINFEQNGG